MLLPDEYVVHLMPFPGDIYACVRIDRDGFPTIYINESLSPLARKDALDHELLHIERGDFFNHLTIHQAETDTLVSRPLDFFPRSFRDMTPEEEARLMLVGYSLMQHLDDLRDLPLPQRLARYRREKHLSFSDLAMITGRTEDELRSYEHDTMPDQETLRVLSRLYGCTL